MSASQRNDGDTANKLAKSLLRAHLQEHRIMAPLQKGVRIEALFGGRAALPQPARVLVRSHKAVFERRSHCALPPWTEALSLVNAFFEQEHTALPLFHPPAFIALLGQQYSGESERSPAWWTAFNAVLAISHRQRVEEGKSAEKERVWGYAANALDTVLDILLRATQLMSVQALLILAWFFLGTPNPQPSFMLVANAIRLAHSIGLHRKNCGSSLSPIERATRINVFWLAFSLDRELSLRTGRPPAQDFGDFDVDLPDPQLQPDFSNSCPSTPSFNAFFAGTRLAVIQAKLYSEMYLSEVLQPDAVREATRSLDRDLQDWRKTFSFGLDLEGCPGLSRHATILRLNYTYYHTVILVHRAQSDLDWRSSNSENPQAFSSQSIEHSVQAARSILKIGPLVPDTWQSVLWDVIPINVTAIIVLSLHILRRPDFLGTADDLSLISDGVRRLISLGHEETESYLRPVTAACQGVYNAAVKAATAHGIMSLENLDRDLGRSVTVSSGTGAGPGSRTYGLRNSSQTTLGAASPFRFESEPGLLTNPPTPLVDTANNISWDQTMTDREIVPWEFEYLLGDNSFDLLG
ncbi:fungal specific transcription factor [Colletotrichum tabaci]|uniref:Fungal specific transcription factor n=1 Tax=Colletotrichum tabaci TaxID=1209068 RepID=A0AAV9T8M7_9PEZI